MKTVTCLLIIAIAALSPAMLAAAGNAQAGQAVYVKTCKTCHGVSGEGNPAIAKALKVPIPNLAAKAVQSKSDDEMKKGILSGTGKMQPVKAVSPAQALDVIAFVRTLAKK